MDRTAVRKIIKYAAYGLLVFLAYVLQTTVFTRLKIFGTMPVLLPVAAAVIAVFEGGEAGAAYGLACGILCDLAFNQATVAMTMVLTVVGAAVGILSDRLLEKGIITCLMCSLGALVITAGVQMFGLVVFRHAGLLRLVLTAIIQTVYSLIFVAPIYYLCRAIRRIPE
ncbi:MAG: rod shape-determining protein MreD [Oscillospiraceae bacterium]|nr:rod shape-determining protein MreD [Oscillospiraceae bacterium]